MKSLFTLLTILMVSISAFAQQGKLIGKVTDRATGEPLIGAVVVVKGTSKGAATDLDGNYEIALEPGTYSLAVNSLSFKPYEKTGVVVAGGKTATINALMESNAALIEAVEVVGTRQTNTEMAVMQQMRQSEVVVSGMSGEQIAKSQDRDAAATVRRIPGVTVMNDRYVVIRGMGQRYNTVMLNDALTPSVETDSRAFSFDLLPTSVIDRILVYKNGSPELPGEFGGGVIKIYTKNVVNENSTTLGVSGSYRVGTTFNNFLVDHKSSTDMLGYDNGYRAIPGGVPANIDRNLRGTDAIAQTGRLFSNTWAPNSTSAMPDLRLSLGLNRQFYFGAAQVSSVSSVSYSNTNTLTKGTFNTYDDFNEELGYSESQLSFRDKVYTNNARLGLVSNWSARLNSNNKIEFRNFFNQLGVSEVLEREGTDNTGPHRFQRNYALRYESRSIYSGQLQGTHESEDDKTTVTWTGGYSYTNRNEPDYRRYRTGSSSPDGPFAIMYQPIPSPSDLGRFYSNLNEHVVMANGQIEHKFNAADSTSENAPLIRAGFYVERKNRDYDARFFSFAPSNTGSFNQSLEFQPINQALAPNNINNTTGWTILEDQNPLYNYKAQNTLLAGFIGGVTPLTEKLSASGGVRVEYNNQQLQALSLTYQQIDQNTPKLSVLPSANFTYELTPRAMLRAGASMSVNRPEFRELAPSPYYDFVYQLEVMGQPNLVTATIYNADMRYEFYPNPTELISIGAFYKYFNKPIETVFANTSGANTITFENSQNAYSVGLEAEVRKSLLNLSESALIQNTTLVLNAALNKSQVQLTETSAAYQPGKRQMVGQSPYVVNAGIYYQDDARQLQVNLLYNIIGQRIFAAGSNLRETIYEMPRNQIDLTITKALGEHFELKAGISDLLNQKLRLIQDSDADNKITSVDEPFRESQRGQYSTVGVTYKF
ncbi:TonB-dependent receptor plug domain-containing protein [Pontibacter qinzhouensis]|uniref:TonB-dependent receptor plug domain-containing protein n=1 Tax=Pontibacter qinzhouensis TaxID=2603253 RepID=A0A5C8K5W8_9BACT|nr:TonB-dependent receptor [Pontibacter qinzhouensis]TXK44637.1 TonB-dependent receptor plug domain-containing protein [Pontibacter qinzhouensis]